MLTNQSMRSFLLVLCLVIFAVIPSPAQDDNRSKLNRRILRSASELDYPPFSLVREDGTADGFSVDLLKAVAHAAGLDINFRVGPWQEIRQELIDGQLDVLPLVSYSTERDKVLDFTTPYLRMHGTIFVRKGETSISSEADLKDKEVLVMRGDIAHGYAVENNLSDRLILKDSFEKAIKLLSKGRYDAVIMQQLAGLELIKKLKISNVMDVNSLQETSLKPVGRPLSGFEQKFCIAVQEGDKELLASLNKGLAIVIANGSYDKLYYKWFGPILPQPAVSWKMMAKSLLFILLPVLFFLGSLGIWYLKRQVARKTKYLNQEIKDRGIVQAALQKSEEKYRSIFDNAVEGLFQSTLEGRFINVNPAFARMLGYASPQELTASISDIAKQYYVNEEDRHRYMQVLREDGSVKFFEFKARCKDGSQIWVSNSTRVIYDQDGKIARYEGHVTDITRQKRAEEEKVQLEAQYRQAQKMESVGRLAGGVAHDYNNALGVIMGFTELAMLKMDPTEPLYSDLNEVLKAAKRAADITRQLLAFARKQTIAPKVLDLNENVESMLNMLRRLIGEDIDFAWMPQTGLWSVKIDPSQIDQILANLCVNARDAIEGVGKVTIETATTIFDAAYCADHAGFIPGEFVLLGVSDNGCGMDKEILDKIFEPFFTTKDVDKGTGLGLATVYGIVKQNNGFVNVYSEPGKGTTIKIYLPRHKGQPVEIQGESTTEIPPGHGETILLVEDDVSILKLVKKTLDGLGYIVLAASTPADAMDLAREHSGKIHLLVTDVIMPEMNGLELSKQLHSFYPDVNCMFMSGYTANAIAHHGVLDEGVYFIQKPFSKKDLAKMVRKALEILEKRG